MKFSNRSPAIVLVCALGAGCVQETVPTVEYFQAHQEERVAQLARCINDNVGSKNDSACVNAREAERLVSVGRLRDLPPTGLVAEKPAEQDKEQTGGGKD